MNMVYSMLPAHCSVSYFHFHRICLCKGIILSLRAIVFQQKSLPDINPFETIHTLSPGSRTAHLELFGQLLSKRKTCSFHSQVQIPCKLLFALFPKKNSLQVIIKLKYVYVQCVKIPMPNSGHLIRDCFFNFH